MATLIRLLPLTPTMVTAVLGLGENPTSNLEHCKDNAYEKVRSGMLSILRSFLLCNPHNQSIKQTSLAKMTIGVFILVYFVETLFFSNT
jgi:hypothetical protein